MANPSKADLAHSIQDVADHLGADFTLGPALFALVETAELLRAQPDLAGELADGSLLTPVEQEIDIAESGIEHTIATTRWPATVIGCVLVQPIVVLPPKAEGDLDAAFEPLLADPSAADDAARAAAASHPDGQRARLHVGVLRGGTSLALLELLTADGATEFRMHPQLGTNLIEALFRTLD